MSEFTAAAVDAAGLADALSGDGTFTVFAPVDSAFEALPKDLLDKLLDPIWQPQLQDVILYHAIGSEVNSSMLSDGLTATTLNGENIVINLDPARVNDMSNILIDEGLVDVDASNGIVHGVDAVLVPTSVESNIVDIAAGNDDFSTLVAAVTAGGLAEALSGEGPVTVFGEYSTFFVLADYNMYYHKPCAHNNVSFLQLQPMKHLRNCQRKHWSRCFYPRIRICLSAFFSIT